MFDLCRWTSGPSGTPPPEDEGTATWYEHQRSGKAQERAKRLRAKFRSRTERRRQVGKRARGHVDEEAMLHGRQPLSPPPPPPPPLPPAVNSARAAKRRRKANAAVNVVCARFAAAVCVEDNTVGRTTTAHARDDDQEGRHDTRTRTRDRRTAVVEQTTLEKEAWNMPGTWKRTPPPLLRFADTEQMFHNTEEMHQV